MKMNFKRVLFLLCASICMISSLIIYADSNKEAFASLGNWKSVRGTEFTLDSGILRIQSAGRLSGCTSKVTITPGRRYSVCAQIRGEGKAALGINGSRGWAYSKTLALNDNWQDFQVSYFEDRPSFSLDLFSASDVPTVFEVRDLAISALPLPELFPVEISARLFLAVDYPGSNGRVESKPGAFQQMAVWGKRWYCAVNLPVPSNSLPLYYYAHVLKDSEQPVAVNLLYGGQQKLAETSLDTANSWKWVRLGPLNAAAAFPEVVLHYGGDPNPQIWVDKIILSTNADMNDVTLNSVE